MNIKSALLGASLLGSMLVCGAAQAATEVEITISGRGDPTTMFYLVLDQSHDDKESEDGFKFGPVSQITDGKRVTDTYRFYSSDEHGGFSDKLGLYDDVGAKFLGGRHGTEFILGDYKMFNRESGHFDDMKITSVSGVPETSTWLMMLSGFAGLGFVGYRRNKLASVAA